MSDGSPSPMARPNPFVPSTSTSWHSTPDRCRSSEHLRSGSLDGGHRIWAELEVVAPKTRTSPLGRTAAPAPPRTTMSGPVGWNVPIVSSPTMPHRCHGKREVSHSPLAEREWGLGEGDQIGPSAAAGHPRPRRAARYSSHGATPSGSASRGARIHTSCAVVAAHLGPRVRQVVLHGPSASLAH